VKFSQTVNKGFQCATAYLPVIIDLELHLDRVCRYSGLQHCGGYCWVTANVTECYAQCCE